MALTPDERKPVAEHLRGADGGSTHRRADAAYEGRGRRDLQLLTARCAPQDASGSLSAGGGAAEHELLVANAQAGEHGAGCS
eukprot:jgi/Tetstr1/442673/TSEL_030767.t1